MSPTGKSFRFVSCVRAVCMSSQIRETNRRGPFPFSLLPSLPFPFSLSGVVLGLDLPKRGFGPDSDPHGSISGSDASPGSFFQAGSSGRHQIQP